MASVRSGGETIRQAVELNVGDEQIARVFHREVRGTLSDSTTKWCEYVCVGDLPDRPLLGWEELVVFTPDHVYRWVQTGYGSNPTVVPRNPDQVVPESDGGTGTERAGRASAERP